MRRGTQRLLPFTCLAGALVLIASEFTDTFRFDVRDDETGAIVAVATIADRHQFAMLVLGLFAIAALFVAIWGGSRPAAAGVAIAGITALMLFLLIDVPDAGKIGSFSSAGQSFAEAKTVPQAGFWLELIGSLVLAVCGTALATLSERQLRTLGPGSAEDGGKGRPKAGALRRASQGAGRS